MKLSFQFFVVLSTVVVGPGWIAAEPCAKMAPILRSYGEYDLMAKCNYCAEHGKGHGQCCDAIYRNSLGRSDDDGDDSPTDGGCKKYGDECTVGNGECYPGLYCDVGFCMAHDNDVLVAGGLASLVTTSSTTSTTTNGGHSFVLIVISLLGAAMATLYNSRHRGLLRRHQYRAMDAPRMDVWWTGKYKMHKYKT